MSADNTNASLDNKIDFYTVFPELINKLYGGVKLKYLVKLDLNDGIKYFFKVLKQNQMVEINIHPAINSINNIQIIPSTTIEATPSFISDKIQLSTSTSLDKKPILDHANRLLNNIILQSVNNINVSPITNKYKSIDIQPQTTIEVNHNDLPTPTIVPNTNINIQPLYDHHINTAKLIDFSTQNTVDTSTVLDTLQNIHIEPETKVDVSELTTKAQQFLGQIVINQAITLDIHNQDIIKPILDTVQIQPQSTLEVSPSDIPIPVLVPQTKIDMAPLQKHHRDNLGNIILNISNQTALGVSPLLETHQANVQNIHINGTTEIDIEPTKSATDNIQIQPGLSLDVATSIPDGLALIPKTDLDVSAVLENITENTVLSPYVEIDIDPLRSKHESDVENINLQLTNSYNIDITSLSDAHQTQLNQLVIDGTTNLDIDPAKQLIDNIQISPTVSVEVEHSIPKIELIPETSLDISPVLAETVNRVHLSPSTKIDLDPLQEKHKSDVNNIQVQVVQSQNIDISQLLGTHRTRLNGLDITGTTDLDMDTVKTVADNIQIQPTATIDIEHSIPKIELLPETSLDVSPVLDETVNRVHLSPSTEINLDPLQEKHKSDVKGIEIHTDQEKDMNIGELIDHNKEKLDSITLFPQTELDTLPVIEHVSKIELMPITNIDIGNLTKKQETFINDIQVHPIQSTELDISDLYAKHKEYQNAITLNTHSIVDLGKNTVLDKIVLVPSAKINIDDLYQKHVSNLRSTLINVNAQINVASLIDKAIKQIHLKPETQIDVDYLQSTHTNNIINNISVSPEPIHLLLRYDIKERTTKALSGINTQQDVDEYTNNNSMNNKIELNREINLESVQDQDYLNEIYNLLQTSVFANPSIIDGNDVIIHLTFTSIENMNKSIHTLNSVYTRIPVSNQGTQSELAKGLKTVDVSKLINHSKRTLSKIKIIPNMNILHIYSLPIKDRYRYIQELNDNQLTNVINNYDENNDIIFIANRKGKIFDNNTFRDLMGEINDSSLLNITRMKLFGDNYDSTKFFDILDPLKYGRLLRDYSNKDIDNYIGKLFNMSVPIIPSTLGIDTYKQKLKYLYDKSWNIHSIDKNIIKTTS